MKLLRIKIFSSSNYKKIPYYSTRDRLKSTLSGLGVGASIGSIGGGLVGGLIGGKKGAMVGAALGGIGLGSVFGKGTWNSTSKESVDRINQRLLELKKQEDLYKRNPKLRYKSLDDTLSLEQSFKNIENKYGIKFKDDFFKLIKLRKLLVPILLDMEKKGEYIDLCNVIMTIDPSLSESWLREEISTNPENLNTMILINPEKADDTWIIYNFKTKKYGYDSDSCKFLTIKSLLLDDLKRKADSLRYYDYLDENQILGIYTLIKNYRDLINKYL